MAWIVSVGLVGLVLTLGRLFVISAQTITRDMNRRFEDLRGRLERDANSLLDELFDATRRATPGRARVNIGRMARYRLRVNRPPTTSRGSRTTASCLSSATSSV